jgi:hypothetical protein
MLWNNLVCLECLNFNHCHGRSAVQKLIVIFFDFIKFLSQIINKISKFQQKENNLIYAEMIKVL